MNNNQEKNTLSGYIPIGNNTLSGTKLMQLQTKLVLSVFLQVMCD